MNLTFGNATETSTENDANKEKQFEIGLNNPNLEFFKVEPVQDVPEDRRFKP